MELSSLSFVLLALVASVVSTRVPPITFADNWEKFHQEGHCFNDLYLFDENLDMDAAIHYNTRVIIVGDFSKPYADYNDKYRLAYLSEKETLITVASELSQQAFPISVFEDCDEAAGFDFYRSLRAKFLAYNNIGPEEFVSPKWYYLNHPDDNCISSFVDEIEEAYNYLVDNSLEDYAYGYSDDSYMTGLEALLTDNVILANEGACAPDEMCYIVFARVNPVVYEDVNMLTVINKIKTMGYQVLTVDAPIDVNSNAAIASWIASEPYSRFSHFLQPPAYPRPQIVGTGVVQGIRGGSSACMSYGNHQILTFDGVGYTQNELGDFVLAKDLFGRSFEVQIRNEQCYPYNQNVACTNGVAVRVGTRSIAFYYNQADNLLAVTVDGELSEPGYLHFEEFEVAVIRKHPVGYEVTLATPDDWTVPFTFIKMEFIYMTTVAVYPAPRLQYAIGGLCGTYDKCDMDEFYTVNEEFAEDRLRFTQSWLVHGGASLFEQSKYLGIDAPFILHPPFLPASWEPFEFDAEHVLDMDMDYCSELVDGPLFMTCLYITQLTRTFDSSVMRKLMESYPNEFNLYDLSVWDPSGLVCNELCADGYSRMGGFIDPDVNCTSICDSQMTAFSGLTFQWPDIQSISDYRFDLPVSGSNFGKQAFFYAPMGGDYLLRVKSSDCCDKSENVEFIITVECPRKVLVVVKISEIAIKIDEFGLPKIEMAADLEDLEQQSLVHIVWEFLDVPEGSVAPTINLPNTLWPNWVPQARGDYVMQIIVTDGCSVSADIVTITVDCYQRDFVLSTKDSDTMMFQYTQEWLTSAFSTTSLHLDKSCLAPIGATTQSEYREFPFSFAPVEWSYSLEPSNPLYTVNTEYNDDGSGAIFEIYYELSQELNTTIIDEEPKVVVYNASALYTTETYSNRGADHQYEYGIQRFEAKTKITTGMTRKITWVEGSYTTFNYIKSIECWMEALLDLEEQDDGTVTSTLSFTAHNAYPENYKADDGVVSFGYSDQFSWLLDPMYEDYYKLAKDNQVYHTGHCPGTYTINVDLIDDFACEAESGHDEYLIDATCVRRPLALPIPEQPCYNIYFRYFNENVYPPAQIWGYDSVVPAYRDPALTWKIFYEDGTPYVSYVNWNFVSTAPYLYDIQFNRDSSLPKPYRSEPDHYDVFLYVTDHCSNAEAKIEVNFVCRDYPTVVLDYVDSENSYNELELPNSVTEIEIGCVDECSIESYNYGALSWDFNYKCNNPEDIEQFSEYFSDTLDHYFGCTIDYSGIYNEEDKNITDLTFIVSANLVGNYEAYLKLEDPCTYNDDTFSYSASCTDASWNLDIYLEDQPVEGEITIEYDPITGEFPEVVLYGNPDNRGITFNWFDVYAEDDYFPYNLGIHYESDMFEVNPVDYDYQTTSVALVAYDGCYYDIKEVTITWDCGDPQFPEPEIEYVTEDVNGLNASELEWRLVQNNIPQWINANCEIEWSFPDRVPVGCGVEDLGDDTWSLTDECDVDIENTMTIVIVLDDGCDDRRFEVDSFTFSCAYHFLIGVDTPIFSQWSNGQFESVCVYASTFEWTKPYEYGNEMSANWQTYVNFWWEFTSNTPTESVFQSNTAYYNSSIPAHTDEGTKVAKPCGKYWWTKDDPECGDGYVMDYTLTTQTTTEYVTTLYTYLLSDEHPENSNLGACFRPDVPGTYELKLTARDGDVNIGTKKMPYCQEVYAYATVEASCDDPPTGVEAGPISDAIVGQRVVLEGQAYDNDDLVYQWQVWTCEDSGLQDMTPIVTNAHGLQASFIPTVAGCHAFSFTVSDGCNPTQTVEDTFDVACIAGGELPEPQRQLDEDGNPITYTTVDFTGVGMLPIHEFVTNTEENVEFEWKIIGFQPDFATWEDVYPPYQLSSSEKDVSGAENKGPMVLLVAIIAAVIAML